MLQILLDEPQHLFSSMKFKTQLENISEVLNNTGDSLKLLESFDKLDYAQRKVLLSSNLLTEEQKEQCKIMSYLSSLNTKYTSDQLIKLTGVSSETLATFGLKEATDSLTVSQLRELASSNAQAKSVLNKIVAQNAQSVVNGKVTTSNISVAASTNSATLATGAFTTAIKANIKAMTTWLTTTPVGWLAILAGGVFAITKAYDFFNVSIEEQKEKMEDSLSSYEDAKSELENITRELESQTQVMDNLLAKDNLTYAEKSELERLQKITKELLIQEDIKKREKDESQKESANESAKLFDRQFGDYNISEEAIKQYQEEAENNPANYGGLITDVEDIASLIAGYKEFEKSLNEAYTRKDQYAIDNLTNMVDIAREKITSVTQDLIDQKSAISDYYNTIKDNPYETLTTDDKLVVDSYNAISNAIALIYKQLDPNKWNSIQIDTAFNTEGVEKTKDELIEMAKAGTLNESVIQKSFPKLNETLENSNMALQEGQSAAKALCNEIYALAKESSNLQNTTITFEPFDSESFTATLNEIQSGYQSLIDAKQEYEDNGGFLSPNTIASLVESGLVDYLENVEGKIKFNTDAYLENAEVMKQNAIMALYDGMCHDINAAAIGNMSEIAPMAKVAIDNLNASAKQGGQDAEQLAIGYIKAGVGADFFINQFGSDDAKNATGETLEQINAIFSTYQKAIQLVDGYDISKSVKPKGSKGAEDTLEDIQKKWKEYLDKYLALYRAELDAGLIDFNTFINKSKNLLDEFYRDGKISGKDYWDSMKGLYETQLSLYDRVLAAVTRRFDKEIQKYQDMIDAVNEQNDALEKQKDDYNGILDAIDSVYEKEIERIESEKQAIQDQIDAIQEEADAYEQLRQKEEALYNLERAQSQRTKKVYTEQDGYIYTQDGEAIRDAQDSLNDIETDLKINDLQKQQDALDETIDKLNEYKDKWAEIPDVHQNALNQQLAIDMFGQQFEKLILENRITDIEAFKDKYIATEQQIQDNTLLIESYEEKIEYYESLKEQWSQISTAYQDMVDDQLAAMFLGEDWEQKVLSGRIDTLNTFKDDYLNVQNEIVRIAWESANAQIKAAEEAQKGADGTPGSGKITNSPSVNNVNNKRPVYDPNSVMDNLGLSIMGNYIGSIKDPLIVPGLKPPSIPEANKEREERSKDNYPRQYQYQKFEKGGVIKSKAAHPIFEKLAREMGEDHIATIAYREGERILTPEQNQLYEKTIEKIFPNFEKMVNLSGAKPFIPNASTLTNQRVEITQNINVTLPNITNDTGFENFKKEMDTFKLQAYQFANRRYR